jgi:hypothetical protein
MTKRKIRFKKKWRAKINKKISGKGKEEKKKKINKKING